MKINYLLRYSVTLEKAGLVEKTSTGELSFATMSEREEFRRYPGITEPIEFLAEWSEAIDINRDEAVFEVERKMAHDRELLKVAGR